MYNEKYAGTKLPTLEEFLALCETADIEIMNIEIKPPLDGNMEIVKKNHYSRETISTEEMMYCYDCYRQVKLFHINRKEKK